MKVLLVDDEPFILQGLSVLIDWAAEGCEIVKMASNGKEALLYLEDHEADLVITDIKMPVMSGLELLEQIRGRQISDAFFIILSGYNDFSYAQKAIRYACMDYLVKPVQKEALLELIRKAKSSLAVTEQNAENERWMQEMQLKQYIIALLRGKQNEEELKYVKERLRLGDGGLRYIHISMQNISPVVKAELLQDHSMAITFGGDSEMSFKNLVDTVGQLMNQLAPEKLSEFRQMNKEEKQSAIDDFLEKYKAKHSQDAKKTETEDANGTEQKEDNEIFETSVPFSLEFSSLDEMLRLIRLAPFTEKMPTSSLYKFQQKYYLVMDLIHFSREELRPFAFTIVEYNNCRYAEVGQIAFIKEHGKCIVENEALQTLMQL